MGLSDDGGSRFEAYVEGLASVIGHQDREGPLRDYCLGLMMPCERKSVPMHFSQRCGARTRNGKPCRSPAMPNGRRRMHGGLSPGPPKGNKNALKHGLCDGGDCWAARDYSAAPEHEFERVGFFRTARLEEGVREFDPPQSNLQFLY